MAAASADWAAMTGWLRAAGTFAVRHDYLLLCAALVPLVMWRVVTQDWLADFWEHAAVIRELAARPLDPLHPMLATDAPHALFSPYALVLAAVSRTTGVDAITVLSLAAIPNFLLLAYALRRFVRVFTDHERAPFWALVFTLLLWGPSPWEWSGFFHLTSFGINMPYPSTFATSLAFLSVAWGHAYLRTGEWRVLAALAVAAWLVILSHPLTGLFLAIGLLALAIDRPPAANLGRLLAGAGAMVVVVGLAVAWPYYPLLGLPGADAAGYARDNEELVVLSSVAIKTFPALIGLPFLVLRARRRWRDPLVLIFVLVSVAYLAGRVSGAHSAGPLIRFVILCLHIAAADGLVRLAGAAAQSSERRQRLGGVAVAAAVGVVLALSLVIAGRGVAGLADERATELSFLPDFVPARATLMTDQISALEVPAWGPTVVAWHYAMPYIEDVEQRRQDVDAFYAGDASEAERRAILCRYDAWWILLDERRIDADPATLAAIAELGEVVYDDRDEEVMLISASDRGGCPQAQAPPS